MPNLAIRLLNMPVERLFNPRKRLNGIVIPAQIWNLLPFNDQPFENIDVHTDCIELLDWLNEFAFANTADLKEYILLDDLYVSYRKTSTDDHTVTLLVTVLKYLFSSKRLLQFFAADDTACSFHLPFLAEATYDLECSYYLMKGGYYKQSLQALRSILEVTLLHAFLALNFLDNDDLENAIKQKYPSLKELIVNLRIFHLLTDKMEMQYFELYKSLSTAVHSEISTLTVHNSFEYKTSLSE